MTQQVTKSMIPSVVMIVVAVIVKMTVALLLVDQCQQLTNAFCPLFLKAFAHVF